MGTHHIGPEPDMAAPEAAKGFCAAGGASLAADAVAPAELNEQRESAPAARAAQSREQEKHPNFVSRAADDKPFLTLRAQLALKGCGLSRTDSADGPVRFYAIRWGLVRELRDLEAVHTFAELVGAAHE